MLYIMAAHVRSFTELKKDKFNDENVATETSREQVKVEESVEQLFDFFIICLDIDPELPLLHREKHTNFLRKGLYHLAAGYECLDASRPWLCYWILHSLYLLDETLSKEETSSVAQFLARCQCEDGGFSGGPQQYGHLAPTYAAVNALCILGTQEAYNVIDRAKLQKFLFKMRTEEGAFKMHDGGEVDVRGAYCALAVARLTNVYTEELFNKTAEWLISCQSYEGGFSGVPGMEAHGGYTFCGLAGLVLLGKERLCDVNCLVRWVVNRQMRFEGGFQGRTNKLVDGCYSFWQGGIFPLIHRILVNEDTDTLQMGRWLFQQEALQEYLLICCQHTLGGLIDKPGKHRDFYHTCYTLSGLSIAQHFASGQIGKTRVVGSPANELPPTHPVYNIGVDAALNASQYFSSLPVPQPEVTSESAVPS